MALRKLLVYLHAYSFGWEKRKWLLYEYYSSLSLRSFFESRSDSDLSVDGVHEGKTVTTRHYDTHSHSLR